ncbi:MAG: hypothetical protein Q8O23_03165, partial [Gallionella sp.]|nr:hypothetical protein [Gallionella sp.]
EKRGVFWGKKGPKNAFFESRLFPYYLPAYFRVCGGEMWRSKAGPPKKGSQVTFLAFFSLLFPRLFSPYYFHADFGVFRGGGGKKGGGTGQNRPKQGKNGPKWAKMGKNGPFGPKKGVFP